MRAAMITPISTRATSTHFQVALERKTSFIIDTGFPVDVERGSPFDWRRRIVSL